MDNQSNSSIQLEPFTEADFDRLISWILNARFMMQWAGPVFSFPLTRSQLSTYLSSTRSQPPSAYIYRVVDNQSREIIGHIELGAIDRENGSARISRVLLGQTEQRGRGIGIQMAHAIMRVAFEDLHLHRVELYIFNFNTSAFNCYQRAGMRHEGTLRDYRRCGDEYWTIQVMAILEDEWRAMQKR